AVRDRSQADLRLRLQRKKPRSRAFSRYPGSAPSPPPNENSSRTSQKYDPALDPGDDRTLRVARLRTRVAACIGSGPFWSGPGAVARMRRAISDGGNTCVNVR